MVNIHKKKFLFIVIEVIVSVLFLVYLLTRPVCNINVPITEGTPSVGRIQEDGYYFDDVHGDLLSNTEEKVYFNLRMNVPAGSYDMRIKYRANNLSFVSIYSPTRDRYVYADNITLTHMPMDLPGKFNWDYGIDYLPGYQSSNIYVTRNIDDMDLYIKYSGYGAFYIENIELIGSRNYVIPIFSVYLFFVIILNIFAIWVIRVPKSDNRRILLCLIGMGLFASIPVLFKEGYHYHDYDFLYSRIEGIAQGLLDGQFPVRIHPQTLRNYGYAVSEFYPELFLYPLGLMRIAGFSLNFCLGLFIVVANIMTAIITYYSVNRVCCNKVASIVGTVLYLFSCYRLFDIYQRGAAGEYIVIAFLPLFVAGIYNIIVMKGSIIPFTVSIFGILNSHLLSCEMVIIFTAICAIVCIKKFFEKRTIFEILKATVITIFLSMYFIVPFVVMSKSDQFRVYEYNAYNTSDSMLSIKEIISKPYSILIPFILMLCITLVIIYYKCNNNLEKKISSYDLHIFELFAGLGLVALFFTTKYFPWKLIESREGIFKQIFCMVQFPSRYLVITNTLFTFAIAIGLNIICKNKIKKYFVIMIIPICAILFQSCSYFYQIYNELEDTYAFYDYGGIVQVHGVSSGEYMPVTFDDNNLDTSIEEYQLIMNNGKDTGLVIESVERSGTKITAVVSNNTGSDQILYFPVTYYLGYKVSNSFESDNILVPTIFETDKGTVGVIIPNGYYNGVHLEYKSPAIFRVGEIISLITLVTIILYFVKNNNVLLNCLRLDEIKKYGL